MHFTFGRTIRNDCRSKVLNNVWSSYFAFFWKLFFLQAIQPVIQATEKETFVRQEFIEIILCIRLNVRSKSGLNEKFILSTKRTKQTYLDLHRLHRVSIDIRIININNKNRFCSATIFKTIVFFLRRNLTTKFYYKSTQVVNLTWENRKKHPEMNFIKV